MAAAEWPMTSTGSRLDQMTSSKKLPVYKIKHDILGYNFDNGRIIAEKTHYEQKHNTRLDPTNDKHQKIIGEILYSSKFYSNTATEELREGHKEKRPRRTANCIN